MKPASEYVRRTIKYYSNRLSDAGQALQDSGSEPHTAVSDIDRDFENIVSAHALLVHSAEQDPEPWLEEICQFGHGAGRYLALRLSPKTWQEWSVLRASYASKMETPSNRSSALCDAGLAAKAQGDFAAARSFFEQAQTIEEAVGDDMGIAQNVGNLAILDAMAGETRNAIEGYRRQIAILEAVGKDRLLGAAYNNLAMALDDIGDEEGALRAFEVAKTNAEKHHDLVLLAGIVGNLGGMSIDRDDATSAQRYYEWQASLAMSLGDKLQETNAHLGMARVHLEEESFTKALLSAEAALSGARASQSGTTLGTALAIYAECLKANGNLEAALRASRQAIKLLETHDPIQARRHENLVRSWEGH